MDLYRSHPVHQKVITIYRLSLFTLAQIVINAYVCHFWEKYSTLAGVIANDRCIYSSYCMQMSGD